MRTGQQTLLASVRDAPARETDPTGVSPTKASPTGTMAANATETMLQGMSAIAAQDMLSANTLALIRSKA